jgi:Glycosyl hydrolases family 16
MKAFFLLSTLLIATPCLADYPTFDRTHQGAALDLTGYTISWQDEFNSFQATQAGQGSGPWFSGVHALLVPGEEMSPAGDTAAYKAVSGVLQMSTRVDSSDNKRTEAHLQTDDGKGHSITFQNGYVEARIWLPKALGSHSGLWLLSKETGSGHTEVDVVEAYGTGDFAVHSSTHIWPIAPLTHQYSSRRSPEEYVYNDYHLYGLLATDSQFIFYYDKKELARIERLPEQRVPLYMLLSVFGNPTQPVIQPATMLVDYVRVYSVVQPMPPTQVDVKQ